MHLANLEPMPETKNGWKHARVEKRELSLAKNFHTVGILSGAGLSMIEAAMLNGWTRPKFHQAEIHSIQSGPVAYPLDPQLLVARIGDLQMRLQEADQRWSVACEQAGIAQLHVAEAVVQTHCRASCLRSEADEDLAEAQRIERGASRWQEVLASLDVRVVAATEEAERMRSEASKARNRWLKQLEAAQERKRQAEEHVADAEAEVEAAEEALDEARDALAEAEKELEKAAESTVCAGKDKDGNDVYEPVDTSPYEAAVSAAEEWVEMRESEYQAAQEDLAEAKAELDRAIQRVEACKRALNFAETACTRSDDAVAQITAARNTHERAVEEQVRISRLTGEAAKIAAEEHSETESMLQGVAEARKQSEHASGYRILVDGDHESARQMALQFNREATERIEMLRHFDAPVGRMNA
jgi:DNA repair exonuclease SbcCD ATPase subunit